MTIKEMRTKLSMTQKEFSDCVGIPLHNIKHWESGFRTPPDYVVDLMFHLLCFKFPDIFQDGGELCVKE